MSRLRVLSIDWDFLVNATLEQRMMLFPDCCNERYPSYLQDVIWSSRYAFNRDNELEQISVDNEALEALKNYISRTCDKTTFCTVWDSHTNLYDEILSRFKGTGSLKIVNVDFHHDMYSSEINEVDCGNWVTFLYEGKNNYTSRRTRKPNSKDSYVWVAREDSDALEESKDYMSIKSIYDLENSEDEKFDLLFICRSSMWSPPHLDDEFEKLCSWVNCNITRAEMNLTASRYTDSFRKHVKELKSSMSNTTK